MFPFLYETDFVYKYILFYLIIVVEIFQVFLSGSQHFVNFIIIYILFLLLVFTVNARTLQKGRVCTSPKILLTKIKMEVD